MTSPDPEFLVVGRITGAFGLHGWVKVLSHTRPPENLLHYSPWYRRSDGAWREMAFSATRIKDNTLLALPVGVTERNGALALVGSELAIPRSRLPEPEPDELYWADLLGLDVVNLQGEHLGRVQRLIETGAHDVMVVQGDRERLIPFVKGVHVQAVDLTARRIDVDWQSDY